MLERQGRGFDVHQRVLAGAEVVCETQRYYEYCEGSVRPRKSLESFVPTEGVRTRAQDWANPNFMGLISLGLEIGVFCDFLFSVLLFIAIWGLDFSGRALSRPQVEHHDVFIQSGVYLVIEKLRTIILRNFLKKVYLVRFLCLRALPSCCPRAFHADPGGSNADDAHLLSPAETVTGSADITGPVFKVI